MYFDEKCLAQFKDIVISRLYPLFAHPKIAKPFILHTDASSKDLGACLSQLNNKLDEKLIACISRTLNKAEFNYSTTEKEMLAATWAMHISSNIFCLVSISIFILIIKPFAVFLKINAKMSRPD